LRVIQFKGSRFADVDRQDTPRLDKRVGSQGWTLTAVIDPASVTVATEIRWKNVQKVGYLLDCHGSYSDAALDSHQPRTLPARAFSSLPYRGQSVPIFFLNGILIKIHWRHMFGPRRKPLSWSKGATLSDDSARDPDASLVANTCPYIRYRANLSSSNTLMGRSFLRCNCYTNVSPS
jgi:hypothetical protein